MAPKLYMHPASYPVRAVLMVAKALDVNLDHVEVDLLNMEQYKPEFLKMNPLHTVPTFVDEDDFVVYDSNSIAMYLVDKYGKDDSLYPKDLKKRTVINQRLVYNVGTLFPSAVAISRGVIMEGMKEIPPEYIERVHTALGYLETFLTDSEFVANNELSIADICILSAVTSIQEFCEISAEKYPNITKWMKHLQELPFYSENVAGLEIFKNLFHNKLAGEI